MELISQIIIFLLGIFFGSGIILLIYFFINSKNKSKTQENHDLDSLKINIQSIQQSLQNFNLAQNRIENTLIRGGALQQGPWGEFVLKNILDSVGLREGKEYETQKAYRNSDGYLQKPDVIVHMPGKRHIVIDSKVSLSGWHDFSNTKDKDEKEIHLKKFLEAVKILVKDLSKDNYQNLYQINTVDNVLMFIPIEPALLTIYDKTVNVYESFLQANQSIDKAKIKMDEAKARLQDGPTSLTKKVQKMKNLGRLSTKKELPIDSYDDLN